MVLDIWFQLYCELAYSDIYVYLLYLIAQYCNWTVISTMLSCWRLFQGFQVIICISSLQKFADTIIILLTVIEHISCLCLCRLPRLSQTNRNHMSVIFSMSFTYWICLITINWLVYTTKDTRESSLFQRDPVFLVLHL